MGNVKCQWGRRAILGSEASNRASGRRFNADRKEIWPARRRRNATALHFFRVFIAIRFCTMQN